MSYELTHNRERQQFVGQHDHLSWGYYYISKKSTKNSKISNIVKYFDKKAHRPLV